MFVKKAKFKKLLKETFKTYGLRLSASKDFYYMGSSWWAVVVKKEKITKEIKAAIIELTGELPEEGETMLCKPEGNQMEQFTNNFINPSSFPDEIIITSMVLREHGSSHAKRVLQDPATGKLILLDEGFMEMISNKEIDIQGKEEKYGYPKYKDGQAVFFANNFMMFQIGIMSRPEESFKYLEQMEDAGIDLIEGDFN